MDYRCIKDVRNETRHVVERLQRAIAGSINDILRRMYKATPTLLPMQAGETETTAVRATELIDRCYYVSLRFSWRCIVDQQSTWMGDRYWTAKPFGHVTS